MKRRVEAELTGWFAAPDRRPLLLRGPRQVGKSTLVRQVAAIVGAELWEVNLERQPGLRGPFESLKVAQILTEIGIAIRRPIGQGRGLLFLDDIQAIPQAIPALRRLHEERPDLAVVAAGTGLGSASELSGPDSSSALHPFHLGPVTFLEFVAATEGDSLADFVRSWRFGAPWCQSAHEALRSSLRGYFRCGGMPEAAAAFAASPDVSRVQSIHRSILETYRDGFSRYSSRSETEKLRRIFTLVPAGLGQKLRWARVDPAWKSVHCRRALERLERQGIVTAARHSDGAEVPLSASANGGNGLRVYFVDGALAQTAKGVDPTSLENLSSARSVNDPLARQFVGQHLRQRYPGVDPELYYFLREGRSGNAEIDFLVQVENRVIPVEIKAGAAGSMRALQQFLALRGGDLAVRFDMNPPWLQEVTATVPTTNGPKSIRFRLLSLPLFMVEQLHAIALALL